MEQFQPNPDEQQRVRSWLESIRQNAAYTPPGATFSIAPPLATLYGDLRYLTDERSLVARVVAFVNRGRKDLAPLDDDAGDDQRAARQIEVQAINQMRPHLLIPLLHAVAADRQEAATRYRPVAEKILATNVWAVPAARPSGALYAHMILISPGALWAFIALLLLDESRGLGKDLRPCETCAKLFLVKPTAGRGRPQKRFCHKRCARAQHDAGSAERRRRARARRQLERKFGRVRSRVAVAQAARAHPEARKTKVLAGYAKEILITSTTTKSRHQQ